jgi:PleD family two-component response regulator
MHEYGRHTGRRMRILVIDDEPFVAKAVSRTLRTAGYEVEACLEWPRVAAVVRRLHPQLILTEAGVAGLTGEETVEVLRTQLAGDTTSPRIVFYSSQPVDRLERLARDCGATGYICKNTPSVGVLLRVAELIRTG